MRAIHLTAALGLLCPALAAAPTALGPGSNLVLARQEPLDPATYDDACNIGYCSVNGATLGGWGGNYTTVTTLEEFTAAVSDPEPAVVLVKGALSGNVRVSVSSSKSVLGLPGSSDREPSALSGIGLYVKGSGGIILRNLKISKVLAAHGAAITIESSRSIWVDHCDLSSDLAQAKGFYGALVSISHGSDYITVTNNLFHDHADAVSIGHSDTNAAEDQGKFHVTMARNYFKNVSSAISYRFGVGHIFSSYYEKVESGINTRMGADLLVESDVFEGSGKAIFSAESSAAGFASVKDVALGGGSNTAPAGTLTTDSLPYPYEWYVWGTELVKKGAVSQAGQALEFMTFD
ncbi:pectin lyase fold/virulence factor [Lasiosphaeris hirsuta]|uniref:Pectin lyase fold/virulence factor n=1 Tax=Lasiosphaeris hirsuta TaxID=260670 RepID=A0AA40DQ51_9PEZI|nr:pectin lyase fold/virulence factor [Lasiosphaeris hirsuta]